MAAYRSMEGGLILLEAKALITEKWQHSVWKQRQSQETQNADTGTQKAQHLGATQYID